MCRIDCLYIVTNSIISMGKSLLLLYLNTVVYFFLKIDYGFLRDAIEMKSWIGIYKFDKLLLYMHIVNYHKVQVNYIIFLISYKAILLLKLHQYRAQIMKLETCFVPTPLRTKVTPTSYCLYFQ